MKWILYILSVLFLFSSCKSVKKLTEKGDYDGAIYLALKKLHGDKNKKTAHVQGLEEAFSKVNELDLNLINHLDAQSHPERWSDVYNLLVQIEGRQQKIYPYLPLISKDGYVAEFNFYNTGSHLTEASAQAALFHYTKAKRALAEITYHDQFTAREAYADLQQIKRYFSDYKDVEELKDRAHHFGKTRIKLQVINNAQSVIPFDLEQEILGVNLAAFSDFWTEYQINPDESLPIDFKSVLEIQEIEVSPEREQLRSYIDRKEVQDGFEYVLDVNGNVQKDTLGNDIKRDRFITVNAEVSELLREKAAYVKGSLTVLNLVGGQVIDHFPISTEATFSSYASNYNGDSRAMCDLTRNRLRRSPEPFPSNQELIWEAAEDVKNQVAQILDEIEYYD